MSPCTSHHPVLDGIFLKYALFEKLLVTKLSLLKQSIFWNLLIFVNCLLNIKWTRSKDSFWRSFLQYISTENPCIFQHVAHINSGKGQMAAFSEGFESLEYNNKKLLSFILNYHTVWISVFCRF